MPPIFAAAPTNGPYPACVLQEMPAAGNPGNDYATRERSLLGAQAISPRKKTNWPTGKAVAVDWRVPRKTITTASFIQRGTAFIICKIIHDYKVKPLVVSFDHGFFRPKTNDNVERVQSPRVITCFRNELARCKNPVNRLGWCGFLLHRHTGVFSSRCTQKTPCPQWFGASQSWNIPTTAITRMRKWTKGVQPFVNWHTASLEWLRELRRATCGLSLTRRQDLRQSTACLFKKIFSGSEKNLILIHKELGCRRCHQGIRSFITRNRCRVQECAIILSS